MKIKSILLVCLVLPVFLIFRVHKSFAISSVLPGTPSTKIVATSTTQSGQSSAPVVQKTESLTQPPQETTINSAQNSQLTVDMGMPDAEVVSDQKIPEELMSKSESSSDTDKNIFLNFDNADLTSFVNYIAEVKKLNLIPDKTLETAKISLSVRDPLDVTGAWNVFLTILEMSGFSIIKSGDVYKVVPKDQKLQQPLPVYINTTPDQIPEDDSNCRYVMFLNNLSVTDYQDMIKGMLSDKGDAYSIKEVNGFIITDKCLNIRSIAKLLFELDQMGGAETATFIKLKNANAIDVKNLLDVLMKKPEISPLARLLGKTAEGTRDYFPPGTKVIAEERLNALILIGDPAPIKKIEDFIVNYIDTELKEAKSPLHVYELQYTDAQQIADLLREVTLPPESVTGQAASKYGAIRGGVKYFRGMTFKVDKDGNRLVVSSTDKVDWKLLKRTIKDLDKPQPQAAIETLIVTVDVEDEKELSGAIRNKKHGQLGKNIDFQSAALSDSGPSLERKDSGSDPVSLLGNMITQITKRQGLAAITIGNPNNIWSIFQALKTQSNTTVLSQPFLTVTNKTTARVKVGQEKRIIQEQTGDGLTGYESVTADTELIITPQINLDGLIRLDIETNINDFLNTQGTQKVLRNLKTNVSVTDGQVLVLGGFVKTKTADVRIKTPLLGDIPILGWLFKSHNRVIQKEYIFIFMSPTILKPREIPGMNLYTKMKLHESTNDIEDAIQTKRTPDPVFNWFFNPEKENYSHKVIDFANARYQPTTVDIKNDPYYRTQTRKIEEVEDDAQQKKSTDLENTISSQPETSFNKEIDTQSNLATGTPIQDTTQTPASVMLDAQTITPEQTLSEQIRADLPQTNEVQKIIQKEEPEPVVKQGIVENTPLGTTEEKKLSVVTESIDKFEMIPDNSKPINQHIDIDMKKRNRLKEFLSNNPMLSQSPNRNRHYSSKGLA